MHPKILLVDDHIMVSKGLRSELEFQFGFSDIQTAASCSDTMALLKKKTYTHLILDIGLSDGSALEILPVIRKLYPPLRIMIFTARSDGAFRRILKKYRIHNFLSKEASEKESLRQLSDFLQNRSSPPIEPVYHPFSSLTAREMEVLYYLLMGERVTKIGRILNLNHSTVSVLKSRIFQKTKTGNLIELRELATIYGFAL